MPMDIPAPRKPDRRRLLWIGGLLLGALAMFGLSRLGGAVPEVASERLVIDSVRRGELVRTTRGPGTLQPESQMQIPAMTSGRVERRLVVPGQRVEAGDVLLELSNPEVSLELLEAERELARAELQLVDLQSGYELATLEVASDVAALRGRIGEERRLSEALERLAQTGGATQAEAAAATEAYRQTSAQIEIAGSRRAVLDSTYAAAVAAQRREVSRLRRIAAFRLERVESMRMTAASGGVVAELAVEQGQWVTSGALLGRLILAGGLKAVVRVPERGAADVTPGQPVIVDLRGSVVEGRVRRVDPSASGGTVAVEIELPDSLPAGARPDLGVEATIEVGRLADVLHVGRPARAEAHARIALFRLNGANRAERVVVETGAASAERIEVRTGLEAGDAVILTDLGELSSAPVVRLQR